MGGYGGYGSRWQPAPVVDVPAVRNLLEQARHRAVERMRVECEGLGGDGVVGVRLTVASFYGNGLEFMAIGTAVRADGAKRPEAAVHLRPVRPGLRETDARRLGAGRPGAGRRRGDPARRLGAADAAEFLDEPGGRRHRRSWSRPRARVPAIRSPKTAPSAAVTRVVLQKMQLNIFETRCAYGGEDAHDHLADAFIWGTAIVPIDRRGRSQTPPIDAACRCPMLRLRQRRPARAPDEARTR